MMRHALAGVIALSAAALLTAWFLARRVAPLDLDALRETRAALEARAGGWVSAGGPRRADGFVYAVDVAHLMEHAAWVGDADLYLRLHDLVARRLVLDDPDDPFTRGFVPWRVGDAPPDASGTTEALRVARALWRGGERFDRPADRALASVILTGYARHAFVDQGIWHVRNYFNLGTRAFANDSYLVDYDADFVAEVAAATGDAALADVAARSVALVRASVSPSGLVHTLLQPDLRTVYPDVELSGFSPNDLIQLNNACIVAETVARSAPEVAAATLAFADARLPDVKRWYYGRTGEAASDREADLVVHACFARLALALGDDVSVRRWVAAGLPGWRGMAEGPAERYYTVGEALLTLDRLLAAP